MVEKYEKSLWFVKKFKEEYNLLKEKENLQFTFEELDKELFLSNSIQQQKIIPQNICFHILGLVLETTYKYSDLYLYLLTPNPGNIVSMKEASFFDEKEKKEFEKKLKETTSFSRKILKERLELIDKNDCKNFDEIIKEAFELFKKNRELLKKIYEKSSKKWLEEEEKEKNEYAF